MAFNLWVPLPPAWTRSSFIGHMRATGLGIVASDAFTVEGAPSESVRICLGGPLPRERLRSALEFMAHTLDGTPAATSTFL